MFEKRRVALIAGLFGLFSLQQSVGQNGSCAEELGLYTDLPFKMEVVQEPVFPSFKVNIKDYGAVNDGVTSNTKAFAAAIDEVVKNGGGTVVIPEGFWLTGPIVLKSKVHLYAAKGALVRFTSDYNEYPMIKTWYEGESTWRAMSPVYADGAENIAITGEGVFDGNGDAWRPLKKFNILESRWRRYVASGGVVSDDKSTWYPTQSAAKGNDKSNPSGPRSEKDCEAIKGALRPVLVNLIKCKKILIDGVTFQNPPAWTLHPLLSENIIIRNIKVYNEEWQTNADAMDLESCRNAIIYNCTFDAGDDAICMKSGKDAEGRNRGVPTENVIVSHCSVYKGHGGFVVGSEMSGGVRNIKVSHCTFMGTDNGLRFKSTRGRGGVVENIYISDINMVDIERDAILYDLYYAVRSNSDKQAPVPTADETTPQFKNIYMKNIVCKGADRAILFQGLPEMNLENINLENAVIEANTGAFCSDANNITLRNVQIYSKKMPVFDIRNATNILVDNFKTSANSVDFIHVAGQKTGNVKFIKSIKIENLKVSSEVKTDAIKIQ
jgi:polygalacturonase